MRRQRKFSAFTLVELIVVVGILVLVAFVLIPGMVSWRQKAKQIRCVSFHKQIATSFRIWGNDYGNRYPMFVSVTNGGTLEYSNEVWRTMQVMSNELGTPLILTCPADQREPDANRNWNTLANSNISYFVCLEADESLPQMPLVGDRFLSTGRPTLNKVLTITTNDTPVWASKNHQGQGTMGLADGSVQQFTAARMRERIKGALAENLEARTNATLRLAQPE